MGLMAVAGEVEGSTPEGEGSAEGVSGGEVVDNTDVPLHLSEHVAQCISEGKKGGREEKREKGGREEGGREEESERREGR